MNIVNFPQIKLLEIRKLNKGKNLIFSYELYSYMSWLGVLCSALTNAAIFSIPIFLFSPIMIIYSMVNVIPNT